MSLPRVGGHAGPPLQMGDVGPRFMRGWQGVSSWAGFTGHPLPKAAEAEPSSEARPVGDTTSGIAGAITSIIRSSVITHNE